MCRLPGHPSLSYFTNLEVIMDQMESRLRNMGFARPQSRKQEVIARSLRRLCDGKFGHMTDIQKEQRGEFGEGARGRKVKA